MANLEAIKAMVAANKQHLQLLNQQLKMLQEDVAADEGPKYWADGQDPYFYTMVGQDDEPGVACVDTSPPTPAPSGLSARVNNSTFEGLIKIQSDAPFVVTHILACMRIDIGKISQSPYGGGAITAADSFIGLQSNIQPNGLGNAFALQVSPDVDLGFVEQGSGRQLFQAEELDLTLPNANNRNILLSPPYFNTMRLFGPAAGSGAGVHSAGPGPNFAFPLVSEEMLPANDVVRVIVRPTYLNSSLYNLPGPTPQAWRVFVTLLGYKIFGD